MSLYDYVVFVVLRLFGSGLSSDLSRTLPLYPWEYTSFSPNWNANDIVSRGGFLLDAWKRVLSDKSVSWWNQIASDPKLLMSTIVWCLCLLITVELCLILPFRWFKRLVRYPNHKLMTPQEVKRSKMK